MRLNRITPTKGQTHTSIEPQWSKTHTHTFNYSCFCHLTTATPPPPIYPPSPPNCTPCSLVPLKQITPRWLSAHFSNYVHITTSNPIISQTLIFQGLSADHLLGEPGFSRQNLSTIMFKWFCPDGLDFLTLTDSHSRNKTLNAFVCASDIWHLCSILLNVLINAVPQRTVRDFSFLTRFYLEHFLKKKSILGSFFLHFFFFFF